jgi:hypothetical protein
MVAFVPRKQCRAIQKNQHPHIDFPHQTIPLSQHPETFLAHAQCKILYGRRSTSEDGPSKGPIDIAINIAAIMAKRFPAPGDTNHFTTSLAQDTFVDSVSQFEQRHLETVNRTAEHMERAEINPHVFITQSSRKAYSNRHPLDFLALDHHIPKCIFPGVPGIDRKGRRHLSIGPQEQIVFLKKNESHMPAHDVAKFSRNTIHDPAATHVFKYRFLANGTGNKRQHISRPYVSLKETCGQNFHGEQFSPQIHVFSQISVFARIDSADKPGNDMHNQIRIHPKYI